MCQEHSFTEEKISGMKLYCGQPVHIFETEAGGFSEFKASLVYKARPTRLSQKKRERLYYTIFVMVICFRLLALNSETYTFAGWFLHRLSDSEKEEASLKFSEAV